MENPSSMPDTSSRPYQNSEGNKPENKKYLILLICLAVIVAGFIITRPKVFRFITGRKMPTPTISDIKTPTPTPTLPFRTPQSLLLTGTIKGVHDVTAFKAGSTYYAFSSGTSLQVRKSTNLLSWEIVGGVFDGTPPLPAWFVQKIPDFKPGVSDLWDPEVSYFGGMYHLYYAVSTGGSWSACIGHATSTTLSFNSFVDQGPIVCSNVDSQDNFIAIGPRAVLDEQGTPWLSFGSAFSIHAIKLNIAGNRADSNIQKIASRTPSEGRIEGQFIVKHGGHYYLFVSFDLCCKGINSTYNIRVGRSTNLLGPYTDKDGKPMLNGGGTLVLSGSEQWRGPGHNAILLDGAKAYNVYHAYDALDNGKPTLRISELIWGTDGWPISGGP